MRFSSFSQRTPHLLAFFVCLTIFVQGCADTGKPIREGDLLRSNGEYEDAIARYEDVFEEFPNATKTHEKATDKIRMTYFEWGETLFNRQSYNDASSVFTELVKRFPESAQATQAKQLMAKSAFRHAERLMEYESPLVAATAMQTIRSDYPDTTFASQAQDALATLGMLYIEGSNPMHTGIFRMNLDGSGLEFIIQGTQGVIAPDGSSLLYLPVSSDEETGPLSRYVFETQEVETIFSNPVCCEPHWFPTSDRFSITKISSTNLFQFVTLDGDKDSHYNQGYVTDGERAFEVLGPVSINNSILAYEKTPGKDDQYRVSIVNDTMQSFTVVGNVPSPVLDLAWNKDGSGFWVVTADAVYQGAQGKSELKSTFTTEETGVTFSAIAFATEAQLPVLITQEKDVPDGARRLHLVFDGDEFVEIPTPAGFALGTKSLAWKPGFLGS